MPRRVFEDHRLVDHRELEVRGRVVDRNARVLREQHHEERDRRERHARVDHELALAQRLDDRHERSGMADERGGEQRHQHRRLGQETDHHLAPRAERAERSADVHAGERHEHAREREQPDQRDHVRGRRERQVGREHRHDADREPHAAEQDVRRGAEQAARRCARAPRPCETACSAPCTAARFPRRSCSAATRGTD